MSSSSSEPFDVWRKEAMLPAGFFEEVKPLFDAIAPPDGSSPDPLTVQAEAEATWRYFGSLDREVEGGQTETTERYDVHVVEQIREDKLGITATDLEASASPTPSGERRSPWHERCHKSGCQRLLHGGERCGPGECAIRDTCPDSRGEAERSPVTQTASGLSVPREWTPPEISPSTLPALHGLLREARDHHSTGWPFTEAIAAVEFVREVVEASGSGADDARA